MSRIFAVWVCTNVCLCAVLASVRLTVKIAYADKIWLAVIHHTGTIYCCICTRHRVLFTAYKYMWTFAYGPCDCFRFYFLSLIRSVSFITFLKSMTKCTAITRAHKIDIQTWIYQTADVMWSMLLLLLNKCIQNNSSLGSSKMLLLFWLIQVNAFTAKWYTHVNEKLVILYSEWDDF